MISKHDYIKNLNSFVKEVLRFIAFLLCFIGNTSSTKTTSKQLDLPYLVNQIMFIQENCKAAVLSTTFLLKACIVNWIFMLLALWLYHVFPL